MNVLSLFGWAEQGFATLKEMKITPTRYFSSEVDPYAIKLAKANFPDIEHIGSVLDVTVNNTAVMWDKTYHCGAIDFLIGWPPCQDLSIAGKRAGLDGEKSSLFWEYVRILKETKPKAFFMENVASMPKEAKATITEALFGIEPMYIDSRLTSCQTRKRLYWLWIRQPDGTYKGIDIPQPEDAGILLKDILEDIPFDAVDKKGEPVWKPVPEKYLGIIEKKICIPEATKKGFVELQEWDCVDMAQPNSATPRGRMMRDKLNGITTSPQFMTIGRFQIPHGNNTGWLYPLEKSCAVNANGDYPNNNKLVWKYEAEYYWRKLTVRECARAQSFPEWYSFDSISPSRAYKAIGNSWEGWAIKHIWKYLLPYVWLPYPQKTTKR